MINMCVLIFYSTSLRSIHGRLHSVDTGYTYCLSPCWQTKAATKGNNHGMVQKITWHWKQDDPLNHAMNYLLTTYFHLRLMSIPGRPTVHVTFHAFHPEKWFPNHTLAHLPCDLQELDNVAVSAAIWSIWIYPSVNMNVPHYSNLDDTSMTRMSRMSQTLLLGLQVYSHLWLEYAGM